MNWGQSNNLKWFFFIIKQNDIIKISKSLIVAYTISILRMFIRVDYVTNVETQFNQSKLRKFENWLKTS